MIYTGLNLTAKAIDLHPYTAYEFQVQCFNDKGGADMPDWVQVETLKSGETSDWLVEIYPE